LSTAVGQKGPVTVSAGSRTSSNPAVAGWSFVGKKEEFSFSFSFSFPICGSVFFWANFRNMATKNEIGILFFLNFLDFLSVKIRGIKIAKIWKKQKKTKKNSKIS